MLYKTHMSDASSIVPSSHGPLRWFVVFSVLLALILVPFFLFEDRLNALATSLLAPERPTSVIVVAIVLLLAADVVLPIPSSLVSTASGALLGFWQGALASWLGMTLGSVLALLIGRTLGEPGIRKIVGPGQLDDAKRFATRHGPLAIVLSRSIPVLAEASILLAAACGMRAVPMLFLSALSNAGLSIVYASIGALAAGTTSFLFVFLGAIVLPGITMLVHRRPNT